VPDDSKLPREKGRSPSAPQILTDRHLVHRARAHALSGRFVGPRPRTNVRLQGVLSPEAADMVSTLLSYSDDKAVTLNSSIIGVSLIGVSPAALLCKYHVTVRGPEAVKERRERLTPGGMGVHTGSVLSPSLGATAFLLGDKLATCGRRYIRSAYRPGDLW
jgi:hypothetical protein